MAVFISLPLGWGLITGLSAGWLGLSWSPASYAVLLAGSLVGGCLAWQLRWRHALSVSCFAAGAAVGFMLWSNATVPNQYEQFYGQKFSMQATVTERPSLTQSGNQAIVMLPDGFAQKVRASLFHYAYVNVGDRVWLSGELKEPENFDDFDYVSYLKQGNIYAEVAKARVIVIEPAPSSVRHWLEGLRSVAVGRAVSSLNEESAAIVLGMLIGDRDKLPGDVEESFRKTGLVHVLVVSGFNLTLIASGVAIVGRVTGRRPADYLSLIVIWLFVLLVGGSSAVVRAGVMASLLIAARLFGRLASSSSSLLLAVAIMCMLNPWRLFYDIGFQLSIAATWGVLEANALRVRAGREEWLAELLWPSCGAMLATAPIISHYFGTFSVVAPVANLAILPLIPVTMLLGALSLLPGLQIMVSPLAEAVIGLQLLIVDFLSAWRFSQIGVTMHPGVMISYYLLLISISHVLARPGIKRLKKYSGNGTMTKIII